MQNANDLNSQIATALTGLIKQIKAIRYYPAKHPALKTSAEETLRGFGPILEGGNYLSLTVKKEEFLFDDHPITKGNEVLAQLATFCFARRIQHLTFLSELNSSDLHHFVHYLLLDPQTIQKKGGIQALLKKARLTTIWTNIRNLDEILEQKKEIEELPEEEDFDPAAFLGEGDEVDAEQAHAEAINLENLLTKLEQEKNDSRFQHSLQELIPLLRLQLSVERRPLVLRAFLMLCRNATGQQYSEDRKQHAKLALSQLSTDETTNFLLEFVYDERTDQKAKATLIQILAYLGEKIAQRLMVKLSDEESAPKRKILQEILVRSSKSIVPVVHEFLHDDRWYVVRNAIGILGEIRSHESLAELSLLLQHDEVRVRRETIRALTKIGGKRAVKILLQTAVNDDQDMRHQAILSLGAMRATAAVPTLLAILKEKGWSQREVDLKKDTIRSLGEIRDPQAIPELLKILKKKRLMRRQLNDELRAAAAAALGDIGDEETRKTLDKATNDRNTAVARAAARAIKQLDKATP